MAEHPSSRDELADLRARIEQLGDALKDALGRIERLESRKVSPAPPILPPTPAPAPTAAPSIKPRETEIVAELVGETAPRPSVPKKIATAFTAGGPFAAAGVGASTPLEDDNVGWEALIGGRGLTWLGGVVLVIALGFTVHWAATTFQTPPELQVVGLHLLGVALLAVGHIAHVRRLPILAQGLAGLAIFELFATGFATYRIYEFGNSYTALAEGSLITVLAIAIALRSKSPAVIILGALGGYLTPILTSTGSGNYAALFGYLAFLNLALIACAVWQGWRFLKPIALAATALMFFGWITSSQFNPAADRWGTQWFLLLHGLIFLAGTTIPPWLWKQRSTPSDLLTLSTGSMGFMGATWALFHDAPGQQLALVSWAMAILHAALFAVTYTRVSNVDRLPRVQLALAAVFVTLAAPLQIDDARYLGITWCVQGLVFSGVGVYFRDRQMQASALLVFSMALVRIFGWDYFSAAEWIVGTQIDIRFALIGMAGLLLATAGAAYWLIPQRSVEDDLQTTFASAAGGGLLAVGNLVVMLAITCQWQGRLVLLLWTLNAAALWIAGFVRRLPAVRWYALYVAVLMAGGRLVHDLFWLDMAGATTIINPRFGTFALLAAIYFVAGWKYWRLRLTTDAHGGSMSPVDARMTTAERGIDPILAVLANVVLLLAVSLEIWHWFENSAASAFPAGFDVEMAHTATYSVVWAVYAAVLVGVGFALRYPLLRYLGLAGFAPILAKVFLIDLQNLELLPRVLAFAVLGVMLLGVSYLYQRYTARLRET